MCESQCCKNMQHIYTADTRKHKTFSRPQKILRLDKKFLFGMAARSGLNIKMYRAPMLTTRAQGGGRTSSRFHVAETLFRQLEPMVGAAMPFAKPYHQAPFWKFRFVLRCRSLSLTSSLSSGISCSPVRQRMSILVANRLLPPARSRRLCLCRSRRRRYRRTCRTGSVFHLSTHSLPMPKPAIIQSSLEHMTWG